MHSAMMRLVCAHTSCRQPGEHQRRQAPLPQGSEQVLLEGRSVRDSAATFSTYGRSSCAATLSTGSKCSRRSCWA
jgi:hypothetical protein